MSPEKKDIYSYHTFILPFVFEKPVEWRKEEPDSRGKWQRCVLKEGSHLIPDHELYSIDYATLRYFTPEARELLFGMKNPKKGHAFLSIRKDAIYCITKGTQTYKLPIHHIHILRLDNGVALLVLEIENCDYHSPEDVRNINEYGRRLNPTTLGNKDPLTADHLSLRGVGLEFTGSGQNFSIWRNNLASAEDMPKPSFWKSILRKMRNAKNESEAPLVASPILNIIKDFAGPNNSITPITDDQMFVYSMICCKELAQELKTFSSEHNSQTTDFNKLLHSAYGEDIRTPHAGSRTQAALLHDCMYDRWQDAGVIDVITENSFFRYVDSDSQEADKLRDLFRNQHCYLTMIAILQQATITRFFNRSREISIRLNESLTKHHKVDRNCRKDVEKLYSDFVKADSSLFIHQISVQSSGVEEFSLLMRKLKIDEDLANLKEKIHNLYELSRLYVEQRENTLLGIIAIIGLPLTLIPLLWDLLVFFEVATLPAAVALCLLGLLVSMFTLYKYRK